MVREQEEFLRKLDEDKVKQQERRREQEKRHLEGKWQDQSKTRAEESFKPKQEHQQVEYMNNESREPFTKEAISNKPADQTIPTNDEFKQLKRKADELMSKFMNSDFIKPGDEEKHNNTPQAPMISERSPDQHKGEVTSPEPSNMRSPDMTSSPSVFNKTSSPSKQKTVSFHNMQTSPSELDYSASDRERVMILAFADTLSFTE